MNENPASLGQTLCILTERFCVMRKFVEPSQWYKKACHNQHAFKTMNPLRIHPALSGSWRVTPHGHFQVFWLKRHRLIRLPGANTPVAFDIRLFYYSSGTAQDSHLFPCQWFFSPVYYTYSGGKSQFRSNFFRENLRLWVPVHFSGNPLSLTKAVPKPILQEAYWNLALPVIHLNMHEWGGLFQLWYV